MVKGLFVLIGVFLFTGCAIRDNLETPFNNATNSPILHDGSGGNGGQGNPNEPKYCVPDAQGHYDGTALSVQVGMTPAGAGQAMGGGCVLRPIREVWAVTNNLEEMKFEAADRFEGTRTINPEPQFTHLYQVTYWKSSGIPITIHWTMEWKHGVGAGTFLEPQVINIKYQKTKGTGQMPIWQGGFVLTKVTDTVTSVAILNQFLAAQGDEENQHDALDAFNEFFRHMRNGPPDWTRLNTGFKDNPDQPDPAPTPATVDSSATTALAPLRESSSAAASYE